MTGVTGLAWADLDAASRPRPRDGVAGVEVDGEVVVYDPSGGRAHVLNATASTVWSVLDGEVTVAVLAEEIADAFQLDEPTVREQLLDLVRELGRRGLLEGVAGAASSRAGPPEQTGCP